MIMKKLTILAILFFPLLIAAQNSLSNDSLVYVDDVIDTTQVDPIVINYNQDTTIPKVIFWIHGLAGDNRSWARVSNATVDQGAYPVLGYPERNAFCSTESYSEFEDDPLFDVARQYIDKVEAWRVPNGYDIYDPYKNIAIAHSQGGLVARAMRRNYHSNDQIIKRDVQFNALATFGTPHGGAQIINSADLPNEEIQAWLLEGCEALGAAEVQAFVGSSWWLDLIVSPQTIVDIVGTACNGLESLVLPIFVQSILKPVTEDYKMGAATLDSLEVLSLNDTMPVVAFYGIEEEPVLWRAVHSMSQTEDPRGLGYTLLQDPFSINDDDGLPNFVNSKAIDYADKEAWHNTFLARFWGQITGSKRKYEIYRDAKEWLQYSNYWWKRFIGARYDSVVQNGYLCYCDRALIPTWVSDPSLCVSNSFIPCEIYPHFENTVYEQASDGVVTARSQVAYEGALRIRMPLTNHMQQRNSIETRKQLNKLWNGELGAEFRLFKK